MLTVIGTLGPGPWSLDLGTGFSVPPPWVLLVISLVAGLGGAALLLAGFWRPAGVNKAAA